MDRPLVRRTARPWINGSRLRQLNHVYARGRSHDERVVPVDHLNVHVAGRRGRGSVAANEKLRFGSDTSNSTRASASATAISGTPSPSKSPWVNSTGWPLSTVVA